MLIYFKGGQSAWFVGARDFSIEGPYMDLLGPRKKFIGRLTRDEIVFWHWENATTDIVTYGWPEKADPRKGHEA